VKADERVDVRAVLSDTKRVERALTGAIREALRRHKLLGESIAVSRDGKVVIVPPEEIEIPDIPEDEPSAR
jgi:hypothetical protein